MDNTLNALCTHLDCAAFSVRVAEKDLEKLGDMIDAIPQARAGRSPGKSEGGADCLAW